MSTQEVLAKLEPWRSKHTRAAWKPIVEATCPKCNQTMTLLFQVDSEDNVPFMFGDSGCGHITQCNEHKDVVAFGWACG